MHFGRNAVCDIFPSVKACFKFPRNDNVQDDGRADRYKTARYDRQEENVGRLTTGNQSTVARIRNSEKLARNETTRPRRDVTSTNIEILMTER